MAYLEQDFIDFLKELTENNHREWFQEQKKRYQKNVKIPFENLVNALIAKVSEFDEPIEVDHKRSVFRINKDIRFSKDKTPYKTNRTAIISKFGTKDKIYPGFYLYVGADKMMIGGGAYYLDKELLYKVRQEISYNLEEFQSLIDDKKFTSTFGTIQGEKNKVIPKEFKEDAKSQSLLYNKGFYFMKELPVKTVFDEKIVEKTIKIMKAGKPINDFLRRAIS